MHDASTDPIATLIRGVCLHLSDVLSTDPIQTMWEGHVQYLTARWLLDNGWAVTFGEPGGDNARVVTISRVNGVDQIVRGSGDCTDSADLRASSGGVQAVLQLKSYPSIGRKRARAGLEKGLRKDWTTLTSSGGSKNPLCFIFVADRSSYLAMRGEREGPRGPRMKWYIDLPSFDSVPLRQAGQPAALSAPVLFRFKAVPEERIVAGLWAPSHAWTWKDSIPPW